MKHLFLFLEYANYSFETEDNTYKFSDTKGNDYEVYFVGPLNREELQSLSIDTQYNKVYELEYLTQDKDYRTLTSSFEPFSISNFIFGEILQDFLSKNEVDAILVHALDEKRMNLYFRTLSRRFKDWRISVNTPEEYDILITRY